MENLFKFLNKLMNVNFWIVIFTVIFAIFGTVAILAISLILHYSLRQSWFLPKKRRLYAKIPTTKQKIFEIKNLILGVFLTAIISYGSIFFLYFNGRTQIYLEFDKYPVYWLVLSFFVALLLSDLYVYIIHRILHFKIPYKYVHKIHHRSYLTNVFSAYSLDLVEVAFYALFLPIFVTLVPLNLGVFLIFNLVTIFYNFYIHSGFEIFDDGNWRFRFINTATFHSLHHTENNGNYGLYTVIWDKLFGTFISEKSKLK